MRVIASSMPYKYWIDGGKSDIHVFDDDYEAEMFKSKNLDSYEFDTPNDIEVSHTYAKFIFDYLTCTPSSKVFLHRFFRDFEPRDYKTIRKHKTATIEIKYNIYNKTNEVGAKYVPNESVGAIELFSLLHALYGLSPFEYWSCNECTNWQSFNDGAIFDYTDVERLLED